MSTPPSRAIFLSYAREDVDAARRIAEALRALHVEVWFDQHELRGGDAWDASIRRQIRECTLFVPVISARTEERQEGYFRREWKLAIDRMHDMAEGVPFLVPVVIDETNEGRALVPDAFKAVHWTRLVHGLPDVAFVQQVQRLLAGPGAATARGQTMEVRAQKAEVGSRSNSRAVLLGGGIALVAMAAALWFFAGRRAPAGAASPDAPALPASRTPDKSIAVLPFANMSDDKDASAFFSDGIHEDILTNLALIRELRVVSRTSVMAYRATTKPMRQIAQELSVSYILEGSVRRAGNKVRVTGQLIRAANDEHVWAQAYDRDLTDVFAIQSELSQQIAAALKTALSPEEKVMITRRPTENPAAYDFVLRARDINNREQNTTASKARRIALLQSAVDLDPAFAQAWGELADACAFAYFGHDEGMDEFLARAKLAIERAVQLAPDDPDVISSLGTYYYYGYRDYVRANQQYERLARLQPNSPIVFNSLGLIQRRQGRWAQSLVNTRRANELDPANINYLRNLAGSLWAGKRWDDALATGRRIVALQPGYLPSAYFLAETSFKAHGSTREMDDFFSRLSPEQLISPQAINLRQTWARTRGDYAEASRLDRLQPYFDEDGDPHWQQAYFAAFDLYAQGDMTAAKARLGDFPAELRQLLEREPKNAQSWAFLSGMELVLGHNEEALRHVERCMELLPESRDSLDGVTYAWYRALVLDWTGDKERALAEYARLLRTPSVFFGSVHSLRHGYSTLHGDPRFEALLADPKNNEPLF